jgi:hypothetical protein
VLTEVMRFYGLTRPPIAEDRSSLRTTSLTGTALSYKPKVRDLMVKRLTELALSQAAAFG